MVEDECSVNRRDSAKIESVNQSSNIDIADEALKDLLESEIFISYLSLHFCSRERCISKCHVQIRYSIRMDVAQEKWSSREWRMLHWKVNLLGQGDSLHNRVSSRHSLHLFPCIRQVRLRFCIPLPQDLEHFSHSRNTDNTYWSVSRDANVLSPLQELVRADSSEQTISGHGSSSLSDPMHNRPLCFGSGLVQVRVLARYAFPHVCGHKFHSLHGDQPPWTKQSSEWRQTSAGRREMPVWHVSFTFTLSNFDIGPVT